MNTKSKWLALFSILLVASMVLAACAQPTPVVETIIETVVVEKEGETVVETVEVEVTVMAEQPAAPREKKARLRSARATLSPACRFLRFPKA